jgi:DNA-binding LacI/PurR family transcriptional regulator
LLLCRPCAAQRKRNNEDSTATINVIIRLGTLSEYFLEFINGMMDTLDAHDMKRKISYYA